MATRQDLYRVNVTRSTVTMNAKDRRRPRSDRSLDESVIYVEGIWLDIDEDRSQTVPDY
jgi:hypothetical protein